MTIAIMFPKTVLWPRDLIESDEELEATKRAVQERDRRIR
jgi:hypothetical protein